MKKNVDHPRHGAPARRRPHGARQRYEHVGGGAEAGIGDGPGSRHVRRDDVLGAVAGQRPVEDRVPHGVEVAKLKRGEIARDEKAEQAERDDRQALQPARRRIGPARRDGVVIHRALMAHAGHHRDEDGERDGERADDHVVGVGRRTRGPEHEPGDQQPQADERRAPLRPAVAPPQRQGAEQHEQEARHDVAPAGQRVAQDGVPEIAFGRDVAGGERGDFRIEQAELERAGDEPGPEPHHHEMRPLPVPVHLSAISFLWQAIPSGAGGGKCGSTKGPFETGLRPSSG
jgi:hypothetical protein